MGESKMFESRIVFEYEIDKFNPETGTLPVETLDRKWSKLAEINFGETSNNREKLIDQVAMI
jgi:hypothetical protein